ncbi:MAG: radical SAM family heme chaperone HemW [Gammaproteobacteria bacterium]|jgi:putative oxygen-independent coproporphyrinogen III oxidase|nr:radical SAM family heme chaperone HemW [Gammaproteobacteria bacterium]
MQKCPYCDFNSHANGAPPFGAYVDALLRDLEWELPRVWGRPVRSIFIGGGTPSLFPDEEIARMLSGIRARLPLLAELEITLEANPGSADQRYFRGYREAGVNRLSIGVQSFNDSHLQALGRIHHGEAASAAVEMAKKVGFEQINLDLMFALPAQTVEMALSDLQQATALGVKHLSWYQLTMEPNTPFGHNPPPLPDEEQLWEIQEAGTQLLQQSAFQQYEISAYAKGEARCQHNLNYWRFGDYLGIGAGAHAKITTVAEGSIIRSARHRKPQSYIDSVGSERVESSRQTVTAGALPLEFMMNRLRLPEPFTPQQFEARTGCSWERVDGKVSEATAQGLLVEQSGKISTTEQGRNFLNDLLGLFQ